MHSARFTEQKILILGNSLWILKPGKPNLAIISTVFHRRLRLTAHDTKRASLKKALHSRESAHKCSDVVTEFLAQWLFRDALRVTSSLMPSCRKIRAFHDLASPLKSCTGWVRPLVCSSQKLLLRTYGWSVTWMSNSLVVIAVRK